MCFLGFPILRVSEVFGFGRIFLAVWMIFSSVLRFLIYPNVPLVIIQLSPEGEVNSGGYIPRGEASRYISTVLHRP